MNQQQQLEDAMLDLKAQLLPIFTRYNALSEDQDVPLDVLRMIAAKDGATNVVECRDNVGMLGQLIQVTTRLIVAEERIERARRRRDEGDAE